MTTYQPTTEWQLHAGAGLGPKWRRYRSRYRASTTSRSSAACSAPSAPKRASPSRYAELRVETTLFYNHLTGLLVPDLFLMCSGNSDEPFCENDGSIPRGQVDAYGVELFAKREVSAELSGWLSYTLGFADGESSSGYEFTPSFDVRHVGNLVVQWNMGAGFSVGGRVHYRSGKVASDSGVVGFSDVVTGESGAVPYNIERRLPGFFRVDAQIIYAWTNSWSRMRISLEWMNLTLSREPLDIGCDEELSSSSVIPTSVNCHVEYAPAIFFPNIGLRAEL